MNRLGHESADFFFGDEVEHTPAFGRQTLFVIGYHTVEEIEAANVICYFKTLTRHNKLPSRVVNFIKNKNFTWMQ